MYTDFFTLLLDGGRQLLVHELFQLFAHELHDYGCALGVRVEVLRAVAVDANATEDLVPDELELRLHLHPGIELGLVFAVPLHGRRIAAQCPQHVTHEEAAVSAEALCESERDELHEHFCNLLRRAEFQVETHVTLLRSYPGDVSHLVPFRYVGSANYIIP